MRTDGSVECWGSDFYGKSSPPPGAFTSIGTGWDHGCGIRPNGSLACWGESDDGKTQAPPGTFTSLSVGDNHTCAVRVDGTVACWGSNFADQATPPAGAFTSVSAGFSHSCGVRTDGSVACWGRNDEGQTSPPAGEFAAVTVGDSFSCGLHPDGTATCWGYDDGRTTPPAMTMSISQPFLPERTGPPAKPTTTWSFGKRTRCVRLSCRVLHGAGPGARAHRLAHRRRRWSVKASALDDGCLFTITGGDTPDPDDGYAVTNADDVPLWDFVRERDLQAIGYPISQRWVNGPFTLQAFQKVILQWDPGKSPHELLQHPRRVGEPVSGR